MAQFATISRCGPLYTREVESLKRAFSMAGSFFMLVHSSSLYTRAFNFLPDLQTLKVSGHFHPPCNLDVGSDEDRSIWLAIAIHEEC